MNNPELIKILNKELLTDLPEVTSDAELCEKLTIFIDHLIETDFEKLVFILYKIDVYESKLKQLLLQNSHENASLIIVKLILEREQQKINSRSQFQNHHDISDEEKW